MGYGVETTVRIALSSYEERWKSLRLVPNEAWQDQSRYPFTHSPLPLRHPPKPKPPLLLLPSLSSAHLFLMRPIHELNSVAFPPRHRLPLLPCHQSLSPSLSNPPAPVLTPGIRQPRHEDQCVCIQAVAGDSSPKSHSLEPRPFSTYAWSTRFERVWVCNSATRMAPKLRAWERLRLWVGGVSTVACAYPIRL